MIINIENQNYYFSKKHFKELRKIIKKKDCNSANVSFESNKEEYKLFMKKHNIFSQG